MELICPSCEARYQVPDASIGEKGRQVSCMNCGHSWHAFTPLVLGSSAAPPTTASPGIDWQTPPRPGRSTNAFPPTESDSPPPPPPRTPEPPRANDQSRSEQLAEIREMLAEVQSEERAAAALKPDEEERSRGASGAQRGGVETMAAPGASTASSMPGAESRLVRDRAADEDDDNEGDPLRRRMALHDRDADRRRTDVEKLRKRHDRRARRQQRAKDTGTGAFLTGFLLIVMIAAIMAAIYMLHPQIAARMPGLEPVLNEYVATIDGFRGEFAEGFAGVIDWVVAMLEG